jgi:hypothetical protein
MTALCRDFGGKNRRTGKPCELIAGWGTDHVGSGKCRKHGGGPNMGRPIEHGRYSVKHAQSLQDKVEAFRHDPEPGNLLDELALNRALLQDMLDKMLDGPVTADARRHIFDMTESIGKTVERIAKIRNQTALTAAEVAYVTARFSDLMVQYIDDPAKRAAFLDELERSVGTYLGHQTAHRLEA